MNEQIDAKDQPVEWDDVQMLVRRGLRRLPFSRVLIVRFDPKGGSRKLWLEDLSSKLHASTDLADFVVNAGVTAAGLSRIGFLKDDLSWFPAEFVSGMSSRRTSQQLGDTNRSSWRWGEHEDEPHFIVCCYSKELDVLEDVVCEIHQLLGKRDSVHTIDTCWSDHEHFGFRDGISNPVIPGSTNTLPADRSMLTAAGEFIFGYSDERGLLPISPTIALDRTEVDLNTVLEDGLRKDIGRNGSFLVVRQLRQDVSGFDRFLLDQGDNAELVAAQLMGRWRDGTPLSLSPDSPADDLKTENVFGYADDMLGNRCPVGAHIRRANPRDGLGNDAKISARRSRNHRIIRRGRIYHSYSGGKLEVERGLLFMCFNVSLVRQFEHIQRNWLFGERFTGGSLEKDPILSRALPGKPKTHTVGRVPVPVKLESIPDFVEVVGGGYFFFPGLKGFRAIADIAS